MKSFLQFLQYITEELSTKKDVSHIRKTRDVHYKFSDFSLTRHRTRYDFKHPDGKRHVTVDYRGRTRGHNPNEDAETRMKKHPEKEEMSFTVHDSKRAINNKTRVAASTEDLSKKQKQRKPKPDDHKHLNDIKDTILALKHRHLSSTKANEVWAKSKGPRVRLASINSERGELEHKDFHHNVHHPEDEHSGKHSYFEWVRKKK